MAALPRSHPFLELEADSFCELPSVPDWAKVRPTTAGGVLTRLEQHRVHSFLCKVLSLTDISEVVLSPDEFAATLVKGCSSLRRRYKGWDLRCSDVCWGWAAMLSLMGRLPCSFERVHPGGRPLPDWAMSSLLTGCWIAPTAASRTSVRLLRLMHACVDSYGFTAGYDSWVVISGGLSSLYDRVRRGYTVGGRSLFYLDAGELVAQNAWEGDCLRLHRGGRVDLHWLEACITDLSLHDHFPLVRMQAMYQQQQLWSFEMSISALDSTEPPYWVCDICSGFQSFKPVVEPTVLRMMGSVPVLYVSVDIAACLVAGTHCFKPTIYGDLLDDRLFPPLHIMQSISRSTKLRLDRCLHVHLSTPCITNNCADHSNRSRGQGYRDATGHRLPIGASTPPLAGETTAAKHQLCIDHDHLETKVFASMIRESRTFGFSFGAENPHGVFSLKPHNLRLIRSGALREVTLNHCAYGHYYEKLTTYLTNFTQEEWSPEGLTGDGRCGGDGRRTGIACSAGEVNPETGRWKHHYAIGRESYREYTPPGYSRAYAKNVLPALECTEILTAACTRYLAR